jgi:hypothetical protein
MCSKPVKSKQPDSHLFSSGKKVLQNTDPKSGSSDERGRYVEKRGRSAGMARRELGVLRAAINFA